MLGQILDLMKDTTLVRDAVEMVIQDARQPCTAITHQQFRRLLGDALAIQLPQEVMPGFLVFADGKSGPRSRRRPFCKYLDTKQGCSKAASSSSLAHAFPHDPD